MLQYKPLVTIYMPTHNRPNNLKRAVASVQRQSYPSWELIIVNDGSTDSETAKFLNQLKTNDKRISVFTNFPAQGACKARNVALLHAKGEFITGLDDDDEFIQNRIEFFLDNWSSEYAFLCTPVIVSQENKLTEHNFFIGDIQFSDLLSVNKVGNQIFCKTKDLLAIKGFNESFKAWQDYDTWLRFSKRFGVGKKLHQSTYIQYENTLEPSITRSGNRLIGFKQFVNEHKHLMNKSQHNAMKCWEKIIKLEYIPLLLIAKSHPDIFKYALLNNIKYILRK